MNGRGGIGTLFIFLFLLIIILLQILSMLQSERFYEGLQPYTFLFTQSIFHLVDKRFKNVKICELGFKCRQWYK